MSLIALGNRLSGQGAARRPNWITLEQHGLFWVDPMEGTKFLVLVVIASSLYGAAVLTTVGRARGLHALSQWTTSNPKQVVEKCLAFLSYMWRQLHWSVFWLPFAIADPGEYVCPSSLERASFCLASSSWLQCAVIAAYLHLLLAARRLCCGHIGSEERRRRGSRGLVWVIWIVVLLILSLLGCIVMATKSVPDFLSLPSSWLTVLSLCIGGCQGLLVNFVIPQLSTRLDKRNSGGLESIASVCTTWVVPSLVTLYLDEACWGYWMRWWLPCYLHGKEFECTRQLLLEGSDVCRRRSGRTYAFCARGTMRKMQAMLLGKLISIGLVFPIANVSIERVPASHSKEMMSKLAALLGMALISAPSLPLMVLLFTMTAFCETFMAVVRYSDRSGGNSAPPIPEEGVVLAVLISNLFHVAFVSHSGAALLLFVLPWARWLACRLFPNEMLEHLKHGAGRA